MMKHGYKIFHLPDPGFVVNTFFPYRTTISFLIAIWRVYPKLKKYITEKSLCAYPAIEVYGEKDIVFMMPLSHQELIFILFFFTLVQLFYFFNKVLDEVDFNQV